MLTIAAIMKNEEKMLPMVLPSWTAAGVPIIVLDTGSSDQTVALLKAEGITVHTGYVWKKDFSDARNTVLGHVKTPWVLMLDADEYLQIESWKHIQDALQTARYPLFFLPIFQNEPGKWLLNTEKNYRIKLFRTDRGYRYHRPVNEELDGISPEDLKDYPILEIPIFHWGNSQTADPEKFQQKETQYIEIFSQAIARPEYQKDALLHFQLGGHYQRMNQKEQAAALYEKAAGMTENLGLLSRITAAWAGVLYEMAAPEQADALLDQWVAAHGELSGELSFIKGKRLMAKGEFASAKPHFQHCLAGQDVPNAYSTLSEQFFFSTVYLGLIAESESDFQTAYTYFISAKTLGEWDRLDSIIERIKERLPHGN